MEGKERYEFLDGSKFASKYGLDVWDDYEDSVFDRINKEIISTEDVVNLLNQQDKRIKELEEENTQLKEEFKKYKTYKTDDERIRDLTILYSKYSQENQQLKQQLHHLPRKIIKELQNIGVVNYDGDLYVERVDINTILKKYGGENE